MLADQLDYLVGVDPHRDSHALAVVEVVSGAVVFEATVAANSGGYALAFWVPSMVKSLSGGTDRATLLYSGLFYACGLAGVFISGQSADRTGDRKWHCAGGGAALGEGD